MPILATHHPKTSFQPQINLGAHQEVHHGMLRLAAELQKSLSGGEANNVYHHARRLYQELVRHIRDEEADGGLYSEARKSAPEMTAQIDRLKEQHHFLLSNLEMICSEVDDQIDLVGQVVEDCLKLLQHHEQDEEVLIDRVYYSDRAASD